MAFSAMAIKVVFAALLLAFLSALPYNAVAQTRGDDGAVVEKRDSWYLQEVGGKRIRIDDQVLDVRLQHMMHESLHADEDDDGPDPATAEGLDEMRQIFDRQWVERTRVPPEMAWVRDVTIPSRDGDAIAARVYRPITSDEVLPVLVYAHGGGWVFGSIEAVDRAVKWLAAEAKVVVISVDYRLAPEAPYPAAWDDAEDAFVWSLANAERFGGDSDRVCVGGDSAGGTLSVVVSMRQIRKARPVPHCQLLYYPGVDNRDIPEMRADYLSSRLFGVGFWLDYTFTEFVLARVFPGRDLASPEISPLFATGEEVERLPPTLLVAAGFDPLRDSNRAYARKLEAAGVEVSYRELPTLIHGIINLTAVTPAAHRAVLDVAREFGSVAHRP